MAVKPAGGGLKGIEPERRADDHAATQREAFSTPKSQFLITKKPRIGADFLGQLA